MDKNFGKNVSKNLISKYSQALLDHAKQSAANRHKTSSKKVTQKTAEATGDLIGNKIANGITKVARNLLQNNSKAIINQRDKEIPI